MGASESKLVFKQGIFRLYEDQNIPADDPFWIKVGKLLGASKDFADIHFICLVLGAT
jgi:hypothetical protein